MQRFFLSIQMVVGLSAGLLRADVVECENGDRYNGKVLLVDERNVKLQNEIAGVLTIPRAKVSAITFGNPKPKAVAVAPARTNAVSSTATIDQIQNQFLGDATPEAKQMYQEMVRDLLSGKLSANDVRTKAQSALKELNDLQSGLGDEDASALLGSYAAILENFLQASAADAPAKQPVPIRK